MKNLRAEEFMTRQPRSVNRDETVSRAVEIMSSEKCGIVPVVNSDNDSTLVGVVTDRDIALRACGNGGHGPDESVEKVMTSSSLFCCSPDDDLQRVTQIMENAGVRRVPVVDGENKVIGIVSLADVARRVDKTVLGSTDDKILEMKPNN